MGFFKTLLASTLGMIIAGLILLFLLIIIVTAQFSGLDRQERPHIYDHSVLHLRFNNEIVDNGPQREFSIGFDQLDEDRKEGLNQITECIAQAKTDPNIKGIFLDLGTIRTGAATLEAIRRALLDFKTSGKFIYAYGEFYDQKAYYLATTANKIYLFPTGLVQHTGLYSEVMFFKGLIDKLGLDVSIIRGSGNKFKSAVEPFMYDKMSEPNRQQISRLQQVIWGQMLKGISETRGISVEQLNLMADSATIRNPRATVQNKLVDELKYRDEVIDLMKEKAGTPQGKKLRLVSLNKYYSSFSDHLPTTDPLVKAARNKGDKIAIIYASGEIVDGKGSNQVIGSTTLCQQIREARLDKSVKAIVLRVDSPGGSALASEVIWRETQLAKAAKPFVVSMGDLAASGGYYISCGSHRIFAEPTTLTGSIGVFGILPHTERFFKENTGITFDRVKTNKYADLGSLTRKMNDDEYKLIQAGVDEIYDDFTKRVAEGRKLDQQLVKDSIGEGRVWSGTDALSLGLVDELGGLDKAIAHAAKTAGVTKYKLKYYPENTDPFQELVNKILHPEQEENENEDGSQNNQTLVNTTMLYKNFKQILGTANLDAYHQVLNLLQQKGVRAQLPYFFTNL